MIIKEIKTKETLLFSIFREKYSLVLIVIQFQVLSNARTIDFQSVIPIVFIIRPLIRSLLSESLNFRSSFGGQLFISFLERIYEDLSTLNDNVFDGSVLVVHLDLLNRVQSVQSPDDLAENRMFAIQMTTRSISYKTGNKRLRNNSENLENNVTSMQPGNIITIEIRSYWVRS